ncbi:hypothetical protein P43SY_006563 [Pythium insidiosum]|uniref:SET domain-containing protein n=1 Tax=Pythium insidiosum TaxID=114742 RepID=A0AAD5L836_PYTIN|nr:hypothetical protein P43SY_006563 [Pythium insidiosum]
MSEALSDAASDKSHELPASLTKVQTALQKFALKHQHSCCDHEDGEEHEHAHEHDHHHHHHHHHHHEHANPEVEGEADEIDECCGDAEQDFVGVEGTALFTGICTMNHSCDPNCTVIYMKDGKAQVYAVQDIKAGEELCISYIDVDQDLEDRQLCLREYQFECHCARCEEERHA